MPPVPLSVSSVGARRFLRRVLLLDHPAPNLPAALEHLGYVQIDPINVCGRMHDLILRNRVPDYREGDLMRHLHGDNGSAPGASGSKPPAARTAFEHHLPGANILVAFPLDAWPHLLATMQRRARTRGPWSGKLTPREATLAEHILAELASRGPLSSEHIADTRRARRVWGASSLAKSTLQKLFFHGRVLISQRVAQRRLYDLPERVLPPAILSAAPPSAAETARWLVLLKLRQRRLVSLKRDERPLVEDLVQPVAIPNCPPLYCLRSDVPLLESCAASAATDESTLDPQLSRLPFRSPPLLLAPLDPLIYDRQVARALWDFDYTWEVYTPSHRRVRGYYALPVLVGHELVGHVDPKADRSARRLVVISRSIRGRHSIRPSLKSLAAFLGLRSSNK